MISENPNEGIPRHSHSPFWAILVVFVTLIILHIAYLVDDLRQRSQIQTAREQLKPEVARIQKLNQTSSAMLREVVVLSSQSAEAERIVKEFNIQINNPGTRTP